NQIVELALSSNSEDVGNGGSVAFGGIDSATLSSSKQDGSIPGFGINKYTVILLYFYCVNNDKQHCYCQLQIIVVKQNHWYKMARRIISSKKCEILRTQKNPNEKKSH
ncbi:23907_t:CDS:2, partial [Gigaspora margarita]